MPEPADEPPPVLWMPSDRAWLDPPLVGRNLYTQFSDVVCTPGNAVPLLGPNHLRWSVTFFRPSVLADPLELAPWADILTGGSWIAENGSPVHLTLTLHGAIVVGAWFGLLAGGGQVRVLEVIRNV